MIREIFQFVSANSVSVYRKIPVQPHPQNVSVIFDLEDGIRDVVHPERTERMKHDARVECVSFFQKIVPGSQRLKISFRINSIHGNEFNRDIKFLAELRKSVLFQYIVIPKINSIEEVKNCLSAFSENQISPEEIIPVIETPQAMESLEQLFSGPATKIFHRAFWGHHDYNLNAGLFPFIEHRSEAYWKLTERLITVLEKAGYGFINGAFLELKNDHLLMMIARAISGLSQNDFDMTALSFRQVKLLSSIPSFNSVHYTELVEEGILSEQQKESMANKIVKQFQNKPVDEKSFLVDRDKETIVSPHQYLAAMNYLHQKIPANG